MSRLRDVVDEANDGLFAYDRALAADVYDCPGCGSGHVAFLKVGAEPETCSNGCTALGMSLAAAESRKSREPIAAPSPVEAPASDWLNGSPMDPLAERPDPLPTVPGFPYAHRGAGVVIVGPTGGGRSSLVQAGAYDAALAGHRVAYLGSEVTEPEFNARAADLARRRKDPVDDRLRDALARVRYLSLATVLPRAWEHPAEWARQMVDRFDIVLVDPLSSVGSVLNLNFDNSNAEFVAYYDKLVQPLVSGGLLVVQLENVGHDVEAKTRAKGASAKEDRADLSFYCKLVARPAPALIVTARKVRSVRAAHKRDDRWTFDRDTQTITPLEASAEGSTTFRPTALMERVSLALEQTPGLTTRDLRIAVKGKHDAKTLATDVLVAEGYVRREVQGAATRHYSARPFRDVETGGAHPAENGTVPRDETGASVPPCPSVPTRAPNVPQGSGGPSVPMCPALIEGGHGGHGPDDDDFVEATEDEEALYERSLRLVEGEAA